MRSYLFRRRGPRRPKKPQQSVQRRSGMRSCGVWLFALLALCGCIAIGLTFGYVLLTDPAAEMVALREEQAATLAALAPESANQSPDPAATSEATPVANQPLQPTPEATAPPALPPRPTDVLTGDVRWTSANGPIMVQHNVFIPAGSRLVIEPGTEVRVDAGVSFLVDGQLLVVGRSEAVVRLLPLADQNNQRWQGIFGNPGSIITIDSAEVQGGGAGGTLLGSKGNQQQPSSLTIRGSYFTNNAGQILAEDSRLDIRDTEISGNEQSQGATINAIYTLSNQVILAGNRLSDNTLSDGLSSVNITNINNAASLSLLIQRNLIVNSGNTSNLVLSTQTALDGAVSCNTLRGGTVGFGIRGTLPQVPGLDLAVYSNTLDQHSQSSSAGAISDGSGRGATSAVALRMYGNWWGDASGPYHPLENPSGLGDAVGENISYAGWLAAPPACAPEGP